MDNPANDQSADVRTHLSDLVAQSRSKKSRLPQASEKIPNPPIQSEGAEPEPKPGLATPTFRLSTLMTVTAILCIGLALAKVVSPVLSGLTMLLLFVVFAHVLGTALGTQLRQSSQHVQPLDLDDNIPNPGSADDENVFAPATRLSHHTQLGLGTKIITGIGGGIGAIIGSGVLWWTMQGDASIPAISLGIVSCAVLGGFFGFGMASLLGVLGGAVIQAHQDPNDQQP